MQDFIATIWTKFVKEYFSKEDNGKLTEKVFVRRIAVGIASIIFCMCAMGISAYAFFTSNITSAENTITAATYDVNVEIKNADIVLTQESDASDVIYKLESNATAYEVKLKATGDASVGYCKIEVWSGDVIENNALIATYYTRPLAPSENEMTFNIQCNQNAVIKFTPNWGSFSGYSNHQPGGNDYLYQSDAWITGFAIGTPVTSSVSDDEVIDTPSVDEEIPEKEQTLDASEEQEQNPAPDKEQQEQEEQQDQAEPNIEEESVETQDTVTQQSEQDNLIETTE